MTNETIGCYEAHCRDYALFGNPERDHWDYEEAARYDRYDGWGDPDPCLEYDLCLNCGEDATCKDCVEAAAWMKENDKKVAADRAAYEAGEGDPTSPNYVPF